MPDRLCSLPSYPPRVGVTKPISPIPVIFQFSTTIHREITLTAISGPRDHAPLHIPPHLLAQQGVHRAPEGEGALAGGI